MQVCSNQALKAAVLFSLFSAAPVYAQGLAVLTGTVRDASTLNPVADVVVTATSPGLQGDQIVVTDGSGAYRIAQLPPGVYTLRIEKESFKPYTRGDIMLRADRTIRVNVELLPEALRAEEVLIVGQAPNIDVGSTTTGFSVSNDFVRNVPVSQPTGRGGAARSFESLAEVAPQAQGDRFGTSVNGATSPENLYLIDGLSVSDPAFGINGSPLTAEFVQEVNVVTGGYMPEYGRSTGGVITAVTKTGSNEFKGSVFGTWTPGGLLGTPREIASEGSALSFTSPLHNVGDFGVELGGPIIKDKLWFYAGVAPNFQRYRVNRYVNRLTLDASGQPAVDAFGFTQTQRIAGSEYSLFSDTRSIQYIGKLTWALAENHTLTAQVNGTPTRGLNQDYQQFLAGPRNLQLQGTAEASLFNTTNDSLDAMLKLNSAFLDKKLLFDVTVGYHSQTIAELPIDNTRPGESTGLAGEPAVAYNRAPGYEDADGNPTDYHNILEFIDASHPGYNQIEASCRSSDSRNVYRSNGAQLTRCPVTRWRSGGPGPIREGDSRRLQARAVGTYLVSLAGRHVLKAGVDVERNDYHSVRAHTGRYAASEQVNGLDWGIVGNFASLESPDSVVLRDKIEVNVNALSTGAFLQDSWTILDRLTINAGLRYDTQNMYGSDGTVAFALPTQISPRVGAIYDFTGEGRSKIYANYAQYYSQVPLNIADRAFGAEKRAFYRAGNERCSPTVQTANGRFEANPAYDKEACATDAENVAANPLLTTNSPNRGGYAWVSADKTVVDPNLKPMSTNELVAGGEYQIIDDGRLGLVYTHRSLLETIEDMSVDNGSSFFIGNPGSGVAAPFPKATRDYDAITLFLDKTFSDGWMTQASYTLSRLHGNYNGLFVNSTGQLDPNSNATFDLVSLLPNQTGPLEADRTHQLKFYGAKYFALNPKMGFTLGASYTSSSGAPINYLVAHPSYGADEGYVLPRGAGGRTPWVHRIDTRIAYDYALTDSNVISLGADVFNLFNFQSATNVDNRFTTATLLPIPNGEPAELERQIDEGELVDQDTEEAFSESAVNPNFKNAAAYQAPRQVRFSVRVTF